MIAATFPAGTLAATLEPIGSGYWFAPGQLYVNAWGRARMVGAMLDTDDGTVQTGIMVDGPDYATRGDLLGYLRSRVPS